MVEWIRMSPTNIIDMYLLIFINTSEVKSHRKYVSPIYGTILPPSITPPLLQGGWKTSSTNCMNPSRSLETYYRKIMGKFIRNSSIISYTIFIELPYFIGCTWWIHLLIFINLGKKPVIVVRIWSKIIRSQQLVTSV